MTARVGQGEWETSVALKGGSNSTFWLIGGTEDYGSGGVGGSDSTEKIQIQIFNFENLPIVNCWQ